jgi:uncharacterized membrane protein
MRKRKIGNLVFTILIICITLLPIKNILAIGQMTEPIELKNVARNQEIEEILIISNSAKKAETYELEAEGEISDWVLFFHNDELNKEPISEITVPSQSSIKAKAVLKIPIDIPNGEYKGWISIYSKASEEESDTTATSVRLRVSRDVLITVTDEEIIDFETAVIPSKYAIKKGDSLKIKLIYYNKGNIQISPSVALKILKGEKTVLNAIYPYPEDENPVKPLERKTLQYLEWSTTGQQNGTHRAELKIMLDDEVVSEHGFRFEVGKDISWYLAALANLGPNKLGIILIGVGIVLLIIFAIRTFVFKKRDWMLLANFVKSIFS